MSINTPADLREYASIPATTVDATLQLYLDMASIIITEDMATCSLTDDRKRLIELNLAAHFAQGTTTSGGGSPTMIKVGQSEERYAAMGNKSYGIATSTYGQQAIALDPCGILAKLAAPALKAKFEVV